MAAERAYLGLRFWTLFLAGLSLAALLSLTVVVVLHAWRPVSLEVVLLYPLFYTFTGSLLASVVLSVFWFALRYPQHRRTLLVLTLITTGVLVAHFYTINSPPTSSCYDSSKNVDGCVMDEIYYVPAAQALLTGEKCGPYADNCNLEHPFLGKAFIAAGIALFGNNDFGWRFFEVLLGTASIPILFAICWSLTRDSTLSLFASFLLGFETLFFVHSSIAVIDVQPVFFALLAFLVYVSDLRLWKLNRFVLAGILLGLSALSKETALFMLIFLVVYHLLFGLGTRTRRIIASLGLFIIASLVFAGGLQLYVTVFGNASMHTFLDDVRYILSYGGGLKGAGWTDSLLGTPITPFSWMTYYSAVGYFVTRVLVDGVPQYVSLAYWGSANFFEVWLTYLWAPYVVFVGYKRWRGKRASAVTTTATAGLSGGDGPASVEVPSPEVVQGQPPDHSFKLGVFALFWFVFTYFPYIALYYYGRVTYPFYFVPAIPAIAIGCAYVFTRRWFPREVAYILLGGVLLWFFLYYPDKSFLPTWLRIVLGH